MSAAGGVVAVVGGSGSCVAACAIYCLMFYQWSYFPVALVTVKTGYYFCLKCDLAFLVAGYFLIMTEYNYFLQSIQLLTKKKWKWITDLLTFFKARYFPFSLYISPLTLHHKILIRYWLKKLSKNRLTKVWIRPILLKRYGSFKADKKRVNAYMFWYTSPILHFALIQRINNGNKFCYGFFGRFRN